MKSWWTAALVWRALLKLGSRCVRKCFGLEWLQASSEHDCRLCLCLYATPLCLDGICCHLCCPLFGASKSVYVEFVKWFISHHRIKAIWILARQEQPFYGPLIALGSTTHYKKTTWVSTTLVSCCVECELVHFLTAGFWALKSGQMLMSEHEKSLWCCLEPSSQIFFCLLAAMHNSRSAWFVVWLLWLFVFEDALIQGVS